MTGKKRGAGEGSLYRRASDGRWVGAVSLGWRGQKRKRRVFYGDTRREVADKMKVALREQQTGDLATAERITVGEFLERWLSESVRPSVRPTTYESYASATRAHLIPGLGRVRLQHLSPMHVQSFINGKLGEGLSPRTVGNLYTLLRRAVQIAWKWGLVSRNVINQVDRPRGGPRRKARPFTPSEARAFMLSVRGGPLEALYLITALYGLRRGEVLGLRWEDVDYRKGVMLIRRSLARVEGGLQALPVKTESSRRALPLVEPVTTALQAHESRQQRDREAMGERWRESGYVFTMRSGGPLEPRRLGEFWRDALLSAGLPHRRFHDLRHSAATFMVALGVPISTISAILGHSSTQMTLDIYSHALDSLTIDAAQKMGALLTHDDGL